MLDKSGDCRHAYPCLDSNQIISEPEEEGIIISVSNKLVALLCIQKHAYWKCDQQKSTLQLLSHAHGNKQAR